MDAVHDPAREARVLLVALLTAHEWCIGRAARAAKVRRGTLRAHLQRYAPAEYAAAGRAGLIYHGGRRGPRGPYRPRLFRSRHPLTKLDRARVAAARHRFAAGGVSIGALAREAGVAHATMCQALDGRTWRTAEGPIARKPAAARAA